MKLKCIKSKGRYSKKFLENKEYRVLDIKLRGIERTFKIIDEHGNAEFVGVEYMYLNDILEFKVIDVVRLKEMTLQQAYECEIGDEFEIVYCNGNKEKFEVKLCWGDKLGTLKFVKSDFNKTKLELSPEVLTAKFIPLPKEIKVNFRKALEVYNSGKPIICRINGEKIIFKSKVLPAIDNPILYLSNKGITSDHILNGEWYIVKNIK